MNIRTILVPVDFSPSADHALDTAVGLAKQFGARLVLLHAYHLDIPVASHVVPGSAALPPGFFDQLRDRATTEVEALAKQTSERGVEATGHAVLDPASLAILQQAEELPADLIVMGTRGSSGLKHVVLGSVAERVIRAASCPVLTVKTGQEH